MRALGLVLVLLGVAAPLRVAFAECGEPGAQLQVLVKAKTAIRRGPGLNYPVSAFIEDGRCMRANDISLDGNWVMVEDPGTKALGWVPSKQLSPASLELLASNRPRKTASPVGSGQERGYLSTLRPVSLLAEPRRGAKEKRTVPGASRVLALAITADRLWVQVRNERNEVGWLLTNDVDDDAGTLGGLPVADGGLSTGSAAITPGPEAPAAAVSNAEPGGPAEPEPIVPPAAPAAPSSPRAMSGPRDGALALELQVMGLFALPQHGLESDGAAGIRRYALKANGGGGMVELRASPIGPLEARVAYGLVVMGGLAQSTDPNDTIGGQQHDIRVLFGYPIALGPVRLIPELGYTGQIFAVTPALKARDEPTFFSHHTHLGTFGARAHVELAGALRVELEGHGVVGLTTEYPFDLGRSGATSGWFFGGGLAYLVSPGFGLLARFELRNVRAPFTGPAPIDATITASTLAHSERHLTVGALFHF